MKIRYTNDGLANYYGDVIEINYKLKNDKILRDYIIKHELEHTEGFDLNHEVKDGFLLLKNPKIFFRILKFYIKNPSTLKDLLPIRFIKQTLYFDVNLMCLYGLLGVISLFAIYLF